MAAPEVHFIDTTFRDGSQSLWASGMTTGMIEAAAEATDQAGFNVVEVPLVGFFMKKFVRDLKEDPWEMARMLARKLPNSVKGAMAGPALTPPDPPTPLPLIRLYYERLVDIGALNRAQTVTNTMDQVTTCLPALVPLYRSVGLQSVMSVSYTISPRHTDEYYAQHVRDLLQFKPDAIMLKDQGGLLTPERARTLIPVFVEAAGGVPVELHCHCTTGLAPLVYLEAIQLGIRTLHTAMPPLANGPSQPSVFNVYENARYLGYKPVLNVDVLRPASELLTAIARQENKPIGAPLEYDQGQFIHQCPGGVISNLKHQLAELGLQSRLDEVLAEAVEVRRELGYPIMITPLSQFVVTQAAINVALGERWKLVTDELVQFAQGFYGVDSGYPWMDQDLRDRILSMPRAKELAQRSKPHEFTMKEIREKVGGPGVSDEDLLLRFFMKGDQEIQAMRAAGPYKRYTSANTPLLTLIQELGKYQGPRFIHIQKGSDSLELQSRSVN